MWSNALTNGISWERDSILTTLNILQCTFYNEDKNEDKNVDKSENVTEMEQLQRDGD